jgi:lipopolysaccharide export LptBFGC system permease protein LptF
MRGSRTLGWSLAREIIQYGLVAFAATSVVLLSQNLLRRMGELTAVGFTLADFGVVLRCLAVMLTAYTIPIALLFGSALALRRRVSDSEVLAMHACGLGIRTLLVPTVAIGVAVSLVSAWLLIAVEHEVRRELISLFNSVAARGSILQAGEFRGIDGRVIYVAKRERDNRLHGVMISDRTQDTPFLIFAEEGRVSLDEDSARIEMQLGRGELHITPGDVDPDRYRRVLFETFEYSFDVSSLLSGEASPRRPKQMSLGELREIIRRSRAGDPLAELPRKEPILYELEIQRRFALPLVPALFALVAVPLALMGRRGSRAWGPLACVALGFSYYAVLTFLQYVAREGWLPPALAFWLPNLALAVIALVLLWRFHKGRSL